jgi:hypothetical protein
MTAAGSACGGLRFGGRLWPYAPHSIPVSAAKGLEICESSAHDCAIIDLGRN